MDTTELNVSASEQYNGYTVGVYSKGVLGSTLTEYTIVATDPNGNEVIRKDLGRVKESVLLAADASVKEEIDALLASDSPTEDDDDLEELNEILDEDDEESSEEDDEDETELPD